MGSEAEHPAGLNIHTAFHIEDKLVPPRHEDVSTTRGSHAGLPSHESNAPREQFQCGQLPSSKPHKLVSAESSAIRFEHAPFHIVSKPSIGAWIPIAESNALLKAQKSAGLADEEEIHFEPRPTRFRVPSVRHNPSRAIIGKPAGEITTRVSMPAAAAPQPELAHVPERPASKTCRRCLLVKPAADFQIDRHNADGMQSYCRECKALRARERRTERIMAPDDEDMLKVPPTERYLATGLGGSTAVAAFGSLLQRVSATLPIGAIASPQVPATEAGFGSASGGNSNADSAETLDLGTDRDPMDSGIVATTAAAALAGAVPGRRRRKGCNPQSSERPGIGPVHRVLEGTQSLVKEVGDKVAVAAVSKGNKCCRKCRQVLALSHFHKNRTTSDGHQLYCKFCHTQALQPSKKAWQAEGQGALASETVVEVPPLDLPQQRLSGQRPQRAKTLMRFYDDDNEPLADYMGAAVPVKKMRTRPVKRKEREEPLKGDSAAYFQLPVAGSARGSHSKGPGGASRDDTASAKKCRRCQVTKPAAEFWRNRSTVDGLQWFCKVCQSMACAAPASRTSHEGKERGHPHGAQAGKGTSNGRAVTGSQMQEVVPTSELGSSARQAAVVVVSDSQQDMQMKCGLQALADAATSLDLQRTTLLAAFEHSKGSSRSQQQQQQLATAQLPTARPMIDPPTMPAVLPVATIGADAVREGADWPPSHSTTIQSPSPAPTGQPGWQLSARQLGSSACTVTSSHLREEVSPQRAVPALGASMGAVAATSKAPDFEDSRRSLNGWLPSNTRFVGTPMGQPQVYRWLPSLAGQQHHQNPLDAAMAAIKRQRVLSAEMLSRHGAVGAGRSPGLFFDPSSGVSQQQLLHRNGESYSNRERTLLQHSWARSHL